MVSLRWAGVASPHRGWSDTRSPENPTLGRRLGAEPAIPLGPTPRPSQGGHDEYQAAAPDGGRITVFRGSTVLQRPPRVSYCVRPTRGSHGGSPRPAGLDDRRIP